MGLFTKLFRKTPEINVATAKIDKQVYLMNYRHHYATILNEHVTPRRLAELFLFRGWTAQFGYRIFSSNPAASEKLLGETVNASKYLGLAAFQFAHGYSVELELGADYISLIQDRWQSYDHVIVATRPKPGIPTWEIAACLTDRLGVADPLVMFGLAKDFLLQLELIKRTAIDIGVLRE